MLPWFFMIHLALHRCLCIWRSSHLFQILWTDLSKGRPSPVGESMLECAVALCLVVQSAKSESKWWLWVPRYVVSCWLRQLGSTTLTVWFLARAVRGLQWLQRLAGSLAVPLGLAARTRAGSNGGQSWWYAHAWLQGPTVGASVMVGTCCRNTHSGRGQGQLWAHEHCGGAGCWCVLMWLQELGTCTSQTILDC